MLNVSSFTTARTQKFGSGGVIVRSAKEPLSLETMQRAAPSIFAETKHDSRSERYSYIPTAAVLDGMQKEGFMPFEVRQGGSRDDNKRNFTKHMIRFRHVSAWSNGVQVGENIREIVLLNAHDGTSSYRLMSGLFRLICANGLIIADGVAQEIRIQHKGDVVNDVVDAAYRIIDESKLIDSQVDNMKAIQLSPSEQVAFAHSAGLLRFAGNEDSQESLPVTASQLNQARRVQDQGNDLWRVFNRTQENLVNGGLHYVQRNTETGRSTYRHTRPVNGIDGNVNLNRALWTLAEEMRKIKQAA